jgi:hypothetical protein
VGCIATPSTAVCRHPRIHSFYRRQKKTWQIRIIDQYVSMLCFLRKYKKHLFSWACNILTEGVFVTQLYSNMGMSVWRIMRVKTNCFFVSDMKSDKYEAGLHCEILSSHIGATADRTLQGCYAVSNGKELPTFWRNVMPPSSEIESSCAT